MSVRLVICMSFISMIVILYVYLPMFKVGQKPLEAQLVDLINYVCMLSIHARIMACHFLFRG